jgi:hypothetical protein
MQSPLQVTIMATLLEDTGEPPQQRYRLFAEYYRTIYKRETRRKLLGGVLTERQKDIDTIHALAGLMLQVAGESGDGRAGSTSSRKVDSALSDEQFRQLVRRRLEQIGISPARASELNARISDGSLQRLVFLVRPRVGWVQFDITSLKEFMAAEAIMNGSDEDVRERIKVIAPVSYWRNVFQFAAGKCFVEREHLLDNLVSVCAGLNESKSFESIIGDAVAGRAANATLWGSRLALDILADGTARQYPGYELLFARIALQLARLDDPESCARLASVYHDDLLGLYTEVIKDRLGQANFFSQVGGWNMLTNLADLGVSWALRMLEERWPVDVEAQETLLSYRGRRGHFAWAVAKVAGLAPKMPPRWFYYTVMNEMFDPSDLPTEGPWRILMREVHSRERVLDVPMRSAWSELIARISVTSMHSGPDLFNAIKTTEFFHADWFPLISGARFGTCPNAKTLANELNWLADRWVPNTTFWTLPVPWPLAICLRHARTQDDLRAQAQAAEQGLLGDAKQWSSAEARWRSMGIIEADFLAPPTNNSPVSSAIAEAGFPFGVCNISIAGGYSSSQLSASIARLRAIENDELRCWLASVLLSQWEFPRGRPGSRAGGLSPAGFRELHSIAAKKLSKNPRRFWLDNFLASAPDKLQGTEWLDLFDWLGQANDLSLVDPPRPELVEDILHHFCSDPEGHKGLLRVIAEFAFDGIRCQIPKHALNLAKTWGPRYRDDAIGLALSRADLAEDEITALASEILSSDELALAVWRALRMAATSSLRQSALFSLALIDLLRGGSKRESDAAERARRLLIEFLTRIPSSLHDPLVWTKLNLPARV